MPSHWFWLLGLISSFYVVLLGLLAFRRRRTRRVRPPVGEALRRPPGHSLEQALRHWDESRTRLLLLYPLFPLLIGVAILALPEWIGWRPGERWTWVLLGLALVVFIGFTVTAGRRFFRSFSSYMDHHLELYGERAVAEWLQPLYRSYYEIFHDLPAEGDAGALFHLDHVTVGPTGVCLIVTKTRRAARSTAGADHGVVFDGRKLQWPWGQDDDGLAQAASEAGWLERWILEKEDIRLKVQPILALPGWWVTESNHTGPVRVANHQQLEECVRSARSTPLTADQTARITRQLDELARDADA